MALAPGAADAPDNPTTDTNDTDTPAPDDQGDDSDVLVTIARGSDGGYVVYQGDEPEGGEDEGEDEGGSPGDGGAAGGGGPGGGGQQVDSIGAALKLALDILNEDASSAGAPGSAEDQFQAGYNAPQAATPASQPGGRRGLPPAAAA